MNRNFKEGSGNIFRDLELPDPNFENIKLDLAVKIFRIIEQKNQDLIRVKKKKLTQAQIGKMLGIEQAETSKLKNVQYSRFSLERLLHFLTCLNYNVDIKLSPARNEHPHQRVLITNSRHKPLHNEHHPYQGF